ncbi:MAG: hypothetical protein GW913_13955 [Myxococcales bacterium]|nr:hypothetical protein [Myxococcales bacterium]
MSEEETKPANETKPAEANDRPLPVARNLVLLVAFLGLVAIGVFTVLLPSLEDAPAERTGAADGGVPTTPTAPTTPAATPNAPAASPN